MGLFDFLFGRKDRREQEAGPAPSFGSGPMQLGRGPQTGPTTRLDENELALQRYRYLLRTAPPDQVEQMHAEAFAQLTPEQRAYVLKALAEDAPEADRAAAAQVGDDPQRLARYATRAELRRPGAVERAMSAPAGGSAMMGGGGMMAGMAGSLLMSFAAGFVGSMVAQQLFASMGDPFAEEGLAEEGLAEEGLAEEEPRMGEGDFGGGDFGGGDFGGGDFGGGDFGGGDW